MNSNGGDHNNSEDIKTKNTSKPMPTTNIIDDYYENSSNNTSFNEYVKKEINTDNDNNNPQTNNTILEGSTDCTLNSPSSLSPEKIKDNLYNKSGSTNDPDKIYYKAANTNIKDLANKDLDQDIENIINKKSQKTNNKLKIRGLGNLNNSLENNPPASINPNRFLKNKTNKPQRPKQFVVRKLSDPKYLGSIRSNNIVNNKTERQLGIVETKTGLNPTAPLKPSGIRGKEFKVGVPNNARIKHYLMDPKQNKNVKQNNTNKINIAKPNTPLSNIVVSNGRKFIQRKLLVPAKINIPAHANNELPTTKTSPLNTNGSKNEFASGRINFAPNFSPNTNQANKDNNRLELSKSKTIVNSRLMINCSNDDIKQNNLKQSAQNTKQNGNSKS